MKTAAELNAILIGNVVCGPHVHLHTFGCIQWECELLVYNIVNDMIHDIAYDIVYDISTSWC